MRKVIRGNHEGSLPSSFFSLEVITIPPSWQIEILGGNSGLGVTEAHVQNVKNRELGILILVSVAKHFISVTYSGASFKGGRIGLVPWFQRFQSSTLGGPNEAAHLLSARKEGTRVHCSLGPFLLVLHSHPVCEAKGSSSSPSLIRSETTFTDRHIQKYVFLTGPSRSELLMA